MKISFSGPQAVFEPETMRVGSESLVHYTKMLWDAHVKNPLHLRNTDDRRIKGMILGSNGQ